MSRGPLLVLALGLLACSAGEPGEVHVLRQAVGVPQDGFPSWEERVILVLTNRARSDPDAENQAVCGGACASYPAAKPLEYTFDRGRAARFQSTSLLLAGSGLMHDSVCTLVSNLGSIYPQSCDGSPSCACEGGTASCSCSGGSPYCTAGGGLTSWTDRVKRFGTSASGENAAAGNSDPIKTFAQWVKSSGHWSNINKSSFGTLGTGHFNGTGGCWKDFWVQVFGGGVTAETLVGGAHHPQTGTTATLFKFWANYYNVGAPQLAAVNIDGTCQTMSLERGTETNGTFLAEQSIATTGCHRYYFYFRDASGAVATYPTSGSFGVGVGAACDDYSATSRPPLGAGCGCITSADCDDGSPCTTDSCVANQCQSTPVPGCCTADAECDDGDVCTADACVANTCQNSAIAGCCNTNAECDDKSPCTTDSCAGNLCQHDVVAGCCTAASECDDADPCTQDSCSANTCQHGPIGGCCKADGECDDGTACTTDACVANKCQFNPISGCCAKDADCADNNPCTLATCQLPAGNCQLSLVEGCCQADVDCDDGDSCTIDTCDATSHTCNRSIAPGCAVPDMGAGSDAGAGGNAPTPQRGVPETTAPLVGGCSVGHTSVGHTSEGPGLLLLLIGLFLLRRRR